MPTSRSDDDRRRPIRNLFSPRRLMASGCVLLATAVLTQTVLAATTPALAATRAGHVRTPAGSPLSQSIARQLHLYRNLTRNLYRGAAPAGDIPRPALHAATGVVPRRSFAVSPPVRRLLTEGLGLELAPGDPLTGDVYSHYVTVLLGAPRKLDFGLPAGYRTPVFDRSLLVSDERTGTLTFVAETASGLGAGVSIAIPRAATSALSSRRDLRGAFEIPELSVLGGKVGLKGAVTYSGGALRLAAVSYDAARTSLDRGDVTVARVLQVSLDNQRGLSVSGRATLGKGRDALEVGVGGDLDAASHWTLRLSPAPGGAPWQPLSNLDVAPSFHGALVDRDGAVRFGVSTSKQVTWAPTAASSETASHIEYSDATRPAGTELPAGYRPGDAWVGTSGRFAVSSGPAGTLRAAGQLAVDLSDGRAVVDAGQSSPLSYGSFAHRRAVTGTGVTGSLRLRNGILAGASTVTTPHDGWIRVAGGDVTASARFEATTGGGGSLPAPAPVPASPARSVATGNAAATSRKMAATPDLAAGSTTGPSKTYKLSSAVFGFLTKTLGIALSSANLSGTTTSGSTVTLNVAAPADVALPLPTGSATLHFGATTLSIDTSTNTLTLSSSASAGRAGATLSVVIKNAGTSPVSGTTDVKGTISVANLTVFGVAVSLTGKIVLKGTSLSFSLTGTLQHNVALTAGVVLESGATVTLASAGAHKGLSVAGAVDLGSGATSIPVAISGMIPGRSNWSVNVSDPNVPSFQPAAGLVVTPDFTGEIKDSNGDITFDLSSANTATWKPAPNVALVLTSIEVSNDKPPSTVSCPAAVDEGTLWLDAMGTVTYTDPGASSPLVTLSGQACIVPTEESFTIGTEATGTLLGGPGSPFTLNHVVLDVNGSFKTDKFSVDGSATIRVGSGPQLTVGMSFDSDGSFVAGVSVPNLSELGINGVSGTGAVWVSSKDDRGFVPSSIPGFTSDATFHLRKGIDVTFTYSLDPTEVSQLRSWGIPVQTSATVVASVSSSGVTVELDLEFGTGENGQTIFDTGGAALYLNAVTIGVTLNADPEIYLSGTATLHLPSVTGNDATSAPSDVSVSLTASFAIESLTIQVGVSLTGQCGDSTCPWQNAFGIGGLTIGTFVATVGVEFGTGIPTPTLDFSLDDVVLPSVIAQPIGLQPDAEISIDVNFDLEAPVVHFGLTAPAGEAALYPLEILGPGSGVQDAIVIDDADFWLAPTGGTLASGQIVAPGASVQFQATFAGVPVLVDAAVSLTTLSVDADVSIGSFSLGPVTFSAGPNEPAVLFKLHIGTDGFTFEFEGGFSFAGLSFSASIDLSAVSSFIGASASVGITAGLPQYLQIGASLHGSFSLDSSGDLNLSVSGSGYLIVAGDNLGSVSFSFSFDSGPLWAAITAVYQQVAQAFENAYDWTANQITAALAGLQYTAGEVASALNYVGVQAQEIGQEIVTFFSGTGDGTLASDLQQAGLTPAQIASVLQSVFNDAANEIADVLDQIGLPEYQIIDALGQLGMTAQSVINEIASFFTGGGSYWISTSDPWNLGVPLYMDVSGASTSPGADVDQWLWNGNYNQDWFVVPTDSGYAELVSRNSGQCLSVDGDSTSAGTDLDQEPCTGDYGQQWLIGSGVYPGSNEAGWTAGIDSRLDGLYVDVQGASGSAGTTLDQWYGNGQWNQSWHFEQAVG